MSHGDGVAGADALGVVEEAAHERDVEVWHLQKFPGLVRTEPEALLHGDGADVLACDGGGGVVLRDSVGRRGRYGVAGVVDTHELRAFSGPEESLVGGVQVRAEEIEPPGEELAFVGVVEESWLGG